MKNIWQLVRRSSLSASGLRATVLVSRIVRGLRHYQMAIIFSLIALCLVIGAGPHKATAHLKTSITCSAPTPTPTPTPCLTFAATLSGSQENPPVVTAGTGTAVVTLDTVTNQLIINASFSGLTGTTTASHIHCCAPVGVNAGVATTVPTLPALPLGVTSGAFVQLLDLNIAGAYNPTFVTANGGTVASARAVLIAGLIGGQTYLNIHTVFRPGGEIRGQLVPDTTPPVIVCPGGLSKSTDSGQFTATVDPGAPVATDNVAVQSVTGVRNDGKALNAPYPIGVTLITWTAKDASGNTASCNQSIAVMAPSGQRRKP